VWLYFNYQPDAAGAWLDLDAELRSDIRTAHDVRATHRLAGVLLTWLTPAVCVLALVRRHRPTHWVGVVVAAFAVVFVGFTGYLLPWDQVGMWAVTVGTDLRGFRFLGGDNVRFVLLDGRQIDAATLLRWLYVHLTVGLFLFALIGWLVRHRKPGPRGCVSNACSIA
jgi:quinol-cytochrome oxidoreductase complex cytochrome b subunit